MAILNNSREVQAWLAETNPQRVASAHVSAILEAAAPPAAAALRATPILATAAAPSASTYHTQLQSPRPPNGLPQTGRPTPLFSGAIPTTSAQKSPQPSRPAGNAPHPSRPKSPQSPLFVSTQFSDLSDADDELINMNILAQPPRAVSKHSTNASAPKHPPIPVKQVPNLGPTGSIISQSTSDSSLPPPKRPSKSAQPPSKKPRPQNAASRDHRSAPPGPTPDSHTAMLQEYIRICEAKIHLLTKCNAVSESTSLSLDAKKIWHTTQYQPKLRQVDMSLSQLRPKLAFLDPLPAKEDLSNVSGLSSVHSMQDSQNEVLELALGPSAAGSEAPVLPDTPPRSSIQDVDVSHTAVQIPDSLPNYSSNIQEARQIIMERRQNPGVPVHNVPDPNESEDDFGEGYLAGLQSSQIEDEETDLSGFIAPEDDNDDSIDNSYLTQATQLGDIDTDEDEVESQTLNSASELQDIRLSQDVAQKMGISYEDEPEKELIEVLDDDVGETGGDFTTQLNEGRDEIVEILSEDELDDVDLDGLKELSYIKQEPGEKAQIISDSDFSDNDDELLQISKNVATKPDHSNEPFLEEVYGVLRGQFRLNEFRSNQLEAIVATLKGKDVFVLIPTGGGKSLCFQLPALVKGGRTRGTTVVVSPLISLMQDQVQHLVAKNIRAGMISSKGTTDERNSTFKALTSGQLDLVYLSPEMINNSGRVQKVICKLHENDMLARVVVDEAHCVSSWGHDFRPDYKGMSFFKQNFPNVPIMALTATANEKVRLDIIHNLRMQEPVLLKQSFNRTNLTYEVKNKPPGIFEWIREYISANHRGKTGIIYCHSKQSCETTAQKLNDYGVSCQFYHAGMDPTERFSVQEQWQHNQIQVICATIAFGMGIDKPDVRFVIHMYIPRSLEGYYQETGRAGRDGNPSDCIMFYSYKDARALQSLIQRDDKLEDSAREAHLLKLQQVVQYCENKTDCRRRQVLHFFNETFDPKECRKMCDNCCSSVVAVSRDVTDHCVSITKLVQSLQADKVTIIHCQDVYKGARHGKILKQNHHTNPFHGLGKDLDRGDIERIFYHLQSVGGLVEYQVMRGGFACTYVKLGPRANVIMKGTHRIELSFAEKEPKSTNGKTTRPPSVSVPDLAALRYTESFVSARDLNSGSLDAPRNSSSSGNSFSPRISLPEHNFNGRVNESNSEIINHAYAELRSLRMLKSQELGYGRANYFISDALLKEMALKLPTNAVDFAKLDAISKEKVPFFQHFKKLLASLARARKKAQPSAPAHSAPVRSPHRSSQRGSQKRRPPKKKASQFRAMPV